MKKILPYLAMGILLSFAVTQTIVNGRELYDCIKKWKEISKENQKKAN